MDGWMVDIWVGGWMDGWMGGWMVDIWVGGWMNRWMVVRWMGGWMGGSMVKKNNSSTHHLQWLLGHLSIETIRYYAQY